jgi:hypothetical protein
MTMKPGPDTTAYLLHLLLLVLGVAGYVAGMLIEVDGVPLLLHVVLETWSALVTFLASAPGF